jgi:hypothetical protein
MIVVKIELLPKGRTKGKRLLGVICVANDGTGTSKVGSYVYALSHAGRYIATRKRTYKKGKVVNFPRHLSPYRLIARILKDAKET